MTKRTPQLGDVLTVKRLETIGATETECEHFKKMFPEGLHLTVPFFERYVCSGQAAIERLEGMIVEMGGLGAVQVQQLRQSADPFPWWRSQQEKHQKEYAEKMCGHVRKALALLESREMAQADKDRVDKKKLAALAKKQKKAKKTKK